MDFKKYLPNKKAFTALLVGAILAILVGAILLIVSYVVINAMFGATIPAGTKCIIGTSNTTGYLLPGDGTIRQTDAITTAAGMSPMCTNGTLNASYTTSISNIAQGLNIAGIGLIVAGIAAIIYMLIGLGGAGAGRR